MAKYGPESVGTRCPIYGGVITDLRTLSQGEYFHVTNGNWDGVIELNDKGDKCVITLTPEEITQNMLLITEENAYQALDQKESEDEI